MNSRSRSGVTSLRSRRGAERGETGQRTVTTGWGDDDYDDGGGGGSVGVGARAGTTIVCVCCRSAANLLLASMCGEWGIRGAANEQPASLELDARVTYIPELVRESDPPVRACARGRRRNRCILFLSLIRKPRARARARHHEKHTAHADPPVQCRRPYSSACPSTGSDVVGDALGGRVLSAVRAGGESGEDTAALRVVTVVGCGTSVGGRRGLGIRHAR